MEGRACLEFHLQSGYGKHGMDSPRRFTNLDGSTPHSVGTILRWGVWDRLTGMRRASPRHAPVPKVQADFARLRTPPPVGAPARLTWLGHASFLVQLNGVSLLIDPVLGDRLFGGIRRNAGPGLAIAHLPRVDAILVTHDHYDHLDLPTIRAVNAPVVAGLRLERWFRDRGILCTELDWWQRADVRGVRVTFVPAQHWARRTLFDANRRLWGGFVVQGTTATIYHAGDSALFEGFRTIGAHFPRIDAALLPIGAYDPAWFMEEQHMSPEQALAAFRDLGARVFVAMHWGTFKLSDEPLDEAPVRLEEERRRMGIPAARVRVPAIGETLDAGDPAV
jgi:L-ascorbate metabolism protein UlaG (beta-lactamase superfamily)